MGRTNSWMPRAQTWTPLAGKLHVTNDVLHFHIFHHFPLWHTMAVEIRCWAALGGYTSNHQFDTLRSSAGSHCKRRGGPGSLRGRRLGRSPPLLAALHVPWRRPGSDGSPWGWDDTNPKSGEVWMIKGGTLWWTNSLQWKMAIEIVDFPIKNAWWFSSSQNVNVHQAG